MAMSMGQAKDQIAGINITPMIDILLVLLIIFMVIVPSVPKGLEASLPQPAKRLKAIQPIDPIVVQVLGHPGASPTYRINDLEVEHAQLTAKLSEIFANRAERTMFVKSDDNVSFATIADVIDMGRAANAMHIGLMTPKTQVTRLE
jgi:biopolymer transport protein TolR